jgi:hypothetical protein
VLAVELRYHRPMLGRTIASVVLLMCGCSCGSGTDPGQGPPPATPPPAHPVSPLVSLEGVWVDEAPAAAGLPTLIVVDGELRLSTDRGAGQVVVPLRAGRVAPEHKRGGEHGFLITPLDEALARLAPAPDARVAAFRIAPSIPYRTVAEVVYTVGQHGRDRLRFLVESGGRTAALPLEIPRLEGSTLVGDDDGALADVLTGGAARGDVEDALLQPTPAPAAPSSSPPGDTTPEPDSLNLSLTVTAAGIIVAGSGGRLAPGCERMASDPGAAVPSRNGQHDWAALARCLALIKGTFPAENRVILAADPEIAFADVARTLATARGTRERPLFPRVWLSAGVR